MASSSGATSHLPQNGRIAADQVPTGSPCTPGRLHEELHTHAAALSLREAQRAYVASIIRSPSTPHPTYDHHTVAWSSNNHGSLRDTSFASPSAPQNTYFPPVSPHLSRYAGAEPAALYDGSSNRAERAGPALQTRIANPLFAPRERTYTWSTPLASPSLSNRLGRVGCQTAECSYQRASPSSSHLTPTRSVQDLGSDFTRYHIPVRDRRSNSAVDLPSHRLGRNLSTVGASQTSIEDSFGTAAAPDSPRFQQSADPSEFCPFKDSRLVAPYGDDESYAFPKFLHETEPDDEMHMPHPDDDRRFATTWKHRLAPRNLVSAIGLLVMSSGVFFFLVALPIMTAAGLRPFSTVKETPLDEFGRPLTGADEWAKVNDKKYPLLKNVRTGLIDPDTPESAFTRKSITGETLELVFSDEFNENNRTFYPGDDPYWTAANFWYGATQDIAWYDPDAVTTWEGALELRLDAFQNNNLSFRTGMLTSWNQLCFKGGVFEVSISLPGPAGAQGLWPGAWSMGNLGKPGHLSTTDGMWPYTYQECDYGITPNQSSPDGISMLPGMKLPSCTCKGEDHPTPGHGRGAPEIDIIEASSWGGLPVATQSYQVAPFDIWYYPDYEFMAFPDYERAFTNTYTGGPFQQAISAVAVLHHDWYDGIAYQKYAYEYVPGTDKDGWIAWFVGKDMTVLLDGRALGQNGNIGSRMISQEPMAMILNLGFSHTWVGIDWASLRFPTVMRVDYVRLYQPPGKTSITCDPEGYETTQYIAEHMLAYSNPNFTKWSDTGYPWPRNTLMHGC